VSAKSDGAPAPVASVCLFCGSSVGARPVYADAARELGRQLARDGVTLVYGGGSVGLMNEAANATLEAGGRVVGVITEALKAREVGHLGLTELHVVATMHQRKALMAQRSDAFVVLPGGYGTLDELCEMLTWDQLGIHAKPIVVVNLEGFFDGLLAQLARAIDDGLLKPEHRALLVVVDRVDEVPAAMRGWQPPTAAKEWRAHAPRP
jgi:uncharacterized protein (TIGR00730 family)